jgi:hypothetical protein
MSLIAKAEKFFFKEINQPANSSCPICLTAWGKNDRVTKLACGHLYCGYGGCGEGLILEGNKKCLICHLLIRLDLGNVDRVRDQLISEGKHAVDPNSAPKPSSTPESFDRMVEYIHFYGAQEQKVQLATHLKLMDKRTRQEEISKKASLLIAAIFGVGSILLGSYWYLKPSNP